MKFYNLGHKTFETDFRKRTILTSSRTVLNAMIAMHVHRQL